MQLKTNRPLNILVATLSSLSLLTMISCSSGDNRFDDAANTTSTSGVITGFGSVFVNGVEYDTAGTSFSEEDAPSTEDDLAVGMVVTVNGKVNSDGVTGTADSISYDDNVEGVVLASTIAVDGKLDVMGQIVTVDADTKFESSVALVTTSLEIVAGNVVEVSGFTAGDGNIYATRIEVKSAAYTPGNEIEVKGKVSSATATTFTIGTLVIEYSTAQLDGLTAPIADGTYVEAKSTTAIDIATKTMTASVVEAEDDDVADTEGSEVELEGVVTAVNANGFVLNDSPVITTASTTYEDGSAADIIAGAKLEAEGRIDADGNLVADEIEFRMATEIEINGLIDAIDTTNNTITVFGQVFLVDNMTAMQDESTADIRYFSLSDLVVGDRVDLHAYADATTSALMTTSLAREDDDVANEKKLQGPLNADIAAVDTTFIMLGITVDLGANSLTGFAATAGVTVEITGDFVGGQFIATSIR